jgi:hypothetical protein
MSAAEENIQSTSQRNINLIKKKLKIEKKDRVCSQETDKYYLLSKYSR